MIKNIIREVFNPDWQNYFYGDCFNEAGAGHFCGNMFIVFYGSQGITSAIIWKECYSEWSTSVEEWANMTLDE